MKNLKNTFSKNIFETWTSYLGFFLTKFLNLFEHLFLLKQLELFLQGIHFLPPFFTYSSHL